MKITHNGRIVQVVEYDVHIGGGMMKTFEKARRAPGVRLIIENKNREILLNKEFRYELDAHDRRLPGGKMVDSLKTYVDLLDAQEDLSIHVLAAAKRECREEVGIAVTEASIFKRLVCGTTMEWDLYYVKVLEYEELDSREVERGGEEYSIVGHEWFSYQKIQKMLKEGLIQEGRSAAILAQIIL